MLRNGWYTENFTPRIAGAAKGGTLDGAAGTGRVSAAARADYAAAAAAVLTADDQAGRVYELAGDGSFSLAELAAAIAEMSGTPVTYRDTTPAEYEAAAIRAGVPEAFAPILADFDVGTAKGALLDESGTLSRLIGRPTTPFAATVAAALDR